MDWDEILSDTKNPEKELVELKQSFNDLEAIGKTIAAFSTKKGGRIYIGFNRDGSPCGTSCENEITGKLQTFANVNIKPNAIITIEKTIFDSKKQLFLVRIDVQKSGRSVYSFDNVPYERRGDTNHPLSSDEVFEIMRGVRKIYFDEIQANSVSENRPAFLTDISEEKIKSFSKGKYESADGIKRFLINNSLTINGSLKLKNAAILLFGKEPQKFVPQAKIIFFLFPSKDVTSEFQRKEFSGDVFEMINGAHFEIRKNINTHSFVIEGGLKRIDIPDYPVDAIREAVVNAVVHRDYFVQTSDILIKIFSDRLEITNPASFPFEDQTFEEIKRSGLSKRRNPLLADALYKMGWVEKGGRGLSKIENEMKSHGLPAPIFDVESKSFKLVLRNASENPKALLHSSPYCKMVDFSSLNERQKEFLKKAESNKSISRGDYMQLLQVNEKTATRDLNDLVKRQILIREGQKRGTKYILTTVH